MTAGASDRWLSTQWSRGVTFWQRISPRTHDLVFLLLAAAITAGMVFSGSELGVVGTGWSRALSLTVLVALWWRRQRPLLVTAIGCLVLSLTSVFAVASIGLLSLAIRRRDLVLVAMALLYSVTFDLGVWGTGLLDGNGVVFSAVAMLAIALGGAYIGARRDLLASLRERAVKAELERELRAGQARVSERSRIAREMHDVLAHKVSLIALHAGGLEVNPAAPAAQVEQSAALIRSTAHQALEDLRDVLGVLRADTSTDSDPAALAPQPGYDALPRLIDSSRAAGVRVTADLAVADLPDPLGRTVFRVVQESLTNVHKHARGAATTIQVQGRAEAEAEVTIVIANRRPVAAGSLLPGSGSGLEGLRERVGLIGGTLQSGPTDDGGWQVRAWLPWPVITGPGPMPATKGDER